MDQPNCRDCKHMGADPDGAYCASEELMPKYKFGLNLGTASNPRLDEDMCGEAAKWFEPREEETEVKRE